MNHAIAIGSTGSENMKTAIGRLTWYLIIPCMNGNFGLSDTLAGNKKHEVCEWEWNAV
jgi:hypothetical protein